MCEFISKTRTFPSQAKNIPTCHKLFLGGLPVSSTNSLHIKIYTYFNSIDYNGQASSKLTLFARL